MKKVLAVYFSQSGQLKTIVQNFMLPFSEAGVDIDMVSIEPGTPFPFPWSGKAFFDAMPESVLGIPAKINNPVFRHDRYDLVILAYQPWFLSPSIPVTSLLHYEPFTRLLKNTSVITIAGARNMWLTAQEKLKVLLKKAEAQLIGNLVMTDRNPNLISAITIQYWMFTGRKERMWGIFPKPGVSEKDINLATRYGAMALESFKNNSLNDLQQAWVQNGAAVVKPILMFVESRASVLFALWARLILRKKNRSLWITVFKYYLIIALFVLSPLVILIYLLLIQPFTQRQIKNRMEYFQSLQYAQQ